MWFSGSWTCNWKVCSNLSVYFHLLCQLNTPHAVCCCVLSTSQNSCLLICRCAHIYKHTDACLKITDKTIPKHTYTRWSTHGSAWPSMRYTPSQNLTTVSNLKVPACLGPGGADCTKQDSKERGQGCRKRERGGDLCFSPLWCLSAFLRVCVKSTLQILRKNIYFKQELTSVTITVCSPRWSRLLMLLVSTLVSFFLCFHYWHFSVDKCFIF